MNYYIKAKVKFKGRVLRLTHAGEHGAIHVFYGTQKAFQAMNEYIRRLEALEYYDIDARIVAISIRGE